MSTLLRPSPALAVLGLVVSAGAAAAAETDQRLVSWYRDLGSPTEQESFGHYLARGASLQHGVAYDETLVPPGAETLRVNLERFECVTFIESALAVARCGYLGDASAECFEREVRESRYRDGAIGDYASRLHYFADWIGDNDARRRIENLTTALGGEPVHKTFFHISKRVLPNYPLAAAERARLIAEMEQVESRLSGEEHAVLDRRAAPAVLEDLQDGDIVAFVRERSGLLVHHAGFIYRVGGSPRLLHASSYHRRVVVTVEDVSDYLLRRPERLGVIVARPLPPEPAAADSGSSR